MFTYVYYSDFEFITQIRSVVKQHIRFYISAIYFSLLFVTDFHINVYTRLICQHFMLS